MSKSDEETVYTYFVSFYYVVSNDWGFGNSFVGIDFPLNSTERIRSVEKKIAKDVKAKGAVLVSCREVE